MISFKGKKNINRDQSFWSKVQQKGPSDCWPWLASKNKDGYGQFWIGSTFIPSHRYAYIFKHKKQLQIGILICHHCDNPECCNPNHLFEGTPADNMKDKVIKNRVNPKKTAHPKFYSGELWLVKRLYASRRFSQKKIAKMFNTNQSVISRAVRGITSFVREDYFG